MMHDINVTDYILNLIVTFSTTPIFTQPSSDVRTYEL